MRTLYESILDDEDVLINDVKKTANNPFIPFLQYVGKDLTKYKDEISHELTSLAMRNKEESDRDFSYLKKINI